LILTQRLAQAPHANTGKSRREYSEKAGLERPRSGVDGRIPDNVKVQVGVAARVSFNRRERYTNSCGMETGDWLPCCQEVLQPTESR
jgi:hypothetical protein